MPDTPRIVHSYSSVKQFEQCPKQFHEVRILKKYKQEETEATRYGTAVHKAIEDYIMESKELPSEFAQFKPMVDAVLVAKGERRSELKMAVTSGGHTRDFFGEDVWIRGIPDLIIVNEEKGVARVADWKTGKSSRYADPDQLELMALLVFMHYPTIQRVKAALVFLVARDVVKAEYSRDQIPVIMSKWYGRTDAIQQLAEAQGPWNARPNNLCRFCPVTSCSHHPE